MPRLLSNRSPGLVQDSTCWNCVIDCRIRLKVRVFAYLLYDQVLESESAYLSLCRASYFGWSYCDLDCPFDFFGSYFLFAGVLGFPAIAAPVSVTSGVSEKFGTSSAVRVTPWIANVDRVALGLLTGFSIECCFRCSQWKCIVKLISAGVYLAVMCFRMLSVMLLK